MSDDTHASCDSFALSQHSSSNNNCSNIDNLNNVYSDTSRDAYSMMKAGGGGGTTSSASSTVTRQPIHWRKFYHPSINRLQAEELLSDAALNGIFILRDSSRGIGNELALSLRAPTGTIHHYLIKANLDGRLLLKGTSTCFPDMSALIDHLSMNQEILPCRLCLVQLQRNVESPMPELERQSTTTSVKSEYILPIRRPSLDLKSKPLPSSSPSSPLPIVSGRRFSCSSENPSQNHRSSIVAVQSQAVLEKPYQRHQKSAILNEHFMNSPSLSPSVSLSSANDRVTSKVDSSALQKIRILKVAQFMTPDAHVEMMNLIDEIAMAARSGDSMGATFLLTLSQQLNHIASDTLAQHSVVSASESPVIPRQDIQNSISAQGTSTQADPMLPPPPYPEFASHSAPRGRPKDAQQTDRQSLMANVSGSSGIQRLHRSDDNNGARSRKYSHSKHIGRPPPPFRDLVRPRQASEGSLDQTFECIVHQGEESNVHQDFTERIDNIVDKTTSTENNENTASPSRESLKKLSEEPARVVSQVSDISCARLPLKMQRVFSTDAINHNVNIRNETQFDVGDIAAIAGVSDVSSTKNDSETAIKVDNSDHESDHVTLSSLERKTEDDHFDGSDSLYDNHAHLLQLLSGQNDESEI